LNRTALINLFAEKGSNRAHESSGREGKGMIKRSSYIRRFWEKPDSPLLDEVIFRRIVRDMEQNGGRLAPAPCWHMDALFKGSLEKQESPKFVDMFAPWLGKKATEPMSREVFEAYRDFLAHHDHLRLLISCFPNLEYSETSPLRASDLDTIMEINLISRFAQIEDREQLYVLEVGGGYGRLAEAFLSVFGDQVKYVLVDAVPASLYYAFEYLRSSYPELRIGFYYANDELDLSKYDCYIAPAWYFDDLNAKRDYKYDVCINIASFQEMEQEQVEYYVDLFDDVAKLNGVIYLCNSRDFLYEREYRYPGSWRLVFKDNTPRSRTPYYPVEVFVKSEGDCSAENALLDVAYLKRACSAYRERISDLRESLATVTTSNTRLQDRITVLQENLAKARATSAQLRKEIQEMRQSKNTCVVIPKNELFSLRYKARKFDEWKTQKSKARRWNFAAPFYKSWKNILKFMYRNHGKSKG
jgi:hypothetical protein